jgi:hypothetical protein
MIDSKDGYDYAFCNEKRLQEIMSLVNAQPFYKLLDLVETMNNQIRVLGHEIKQLKESRECQEQ